MATVAKVWLVGEQSLPVGDRIPGMQGIEFGFVAEPQALREQLSPGENIVALVAPHELDRMQELFQGWKLIMLPALPKTEPKHFRFQVHSLLQAARLEYELAISDAVAWKSFSADSAITVEFLGQAMLEIFSCRDQTSIESVLFNKCCLLAPVDSIVIYDDPPFVPFSEAQFFQLAVPVQSGGKLLAHVYARFAQEKGEVLDKSCDRVGEALIALCDAVGLAIARNRLLQTTRDSSLIWEATFDAVADPVALLNCNYRVLRANQAFAHFFAAEKEDFVGKELAEVCLEIASFLSSPKPEWEWARHGRHYRVSVDSIEADQFFDPASAGNFVLRIHDATAEKALHEQILAREQAADMGILIGSVAHEINNPVAGILMFAQLLLRQIATSDALYADIAALESAAQRIKRIIETMLALVRNADDQPECLSYQECLQNVLELIGPEAKRLRIALSLEPELSAAKNVFVRAVRAKLLQAFFQLLQQTFVNLEATMADKPNFRAELALILEAEAANGRVVLHALDNGRPMPQVDESSVAFNVVKILVEEQGGTLEYRREGERNRQILGLPLLLTS